MHYVSCKIAYMLINLVNRHLYKTKKQWWKPVIVAGNAKFHIFILLTPLLRFSTSILNIMVGLLQNDQLFRKNSTLCSVFCIQV